MKTPRIIIFVVMLFGLSAGAQGLLSPIYFTNQPAILAGRTVFAAVSGGDTQSKTNALALIGKQVVFAGDIKQPEIKIIVQPPRVIEDGRLMLSSNVVVDVEIDTNEVRPHTFAFTAEVLGTLKSVDFQNRVIHIRAKPEDWIVRDLLRR